MTELQLGLIGLGAAAVVGVLGYNQWQARQHRKLAERVLKSEHSDVLLGGSEAPRKQAVTEERSEPAFVERREPALEEPAIIADPAATAEPVAEPEPMPEPVAAPQTPPPPPAVQEEVPEAPAGDIPVSLLDPRLEFIVTLELVEPVAGIQIWQSQRENLLRVSKPVYIVGFNDRSREWELVSPDSGFGYRRLRIGLQLADRRGPLSEADLAVFSASMKELADELLAVADMPSVRVLDQALKLDRFAAEVDLEIGVNLVSQGLPFSGTKIRALAEAAGMVLGVDGLFSRYDDSGRSQFSLQNFESTPFSPDSIKTMSTHGLTFLLDVPRVDHGERVFYQMVELAKRFADTLQGTLVDDNRQPLSDAQLDRIKRDFVMKPQAAMSSFGLPAGSPQALRLFS